MKSLSDDMIHGGIARSLLLFSVPLFLSYLLQALYGSIDAIIVGRYAALGDVTGVTHGSQVINIMTQGVSGLTTGGTVLITRYVGAKREEDLQQSIITLFSLFAIASVALMILSLLCNDVLLNILRTPEAARMPMLRYLQVCQIGIPCIFFYNCISAVLQALGDSRHPLLFVGIACAVNVLLDLLLVKVFQLGSFGAAIATVLSQLLSVVLSIRYLRRQGFSFDFSLRGFRIHSDKLRLLLKLGLPYAAMRVVVASAYLVISGLSNAYGLAASSAAGVVSKINNFATMPFSALQVAVATMAGQNIGAGSLKRSKRTLTVGLGISYAIGISTFLIVQMLPQQLLGLFAPNPEMMQVGERFLRFFSLSYLLMPFTYTIHGFYTACGYTWMPSLDGVLASIVFRIPLAILLSKYMGFPGIALGSSIAVFGAVIPAAIFYFSGIWKRALEQSNL